MTATIKSLYAASASMTCTIDSLASSATAGRESTVVDNSSNLYLDALVFITLVTINSAPANDKAVYLWSYAGDGGSLYTEVATGSDAAYTRREPTTLRLVGVVPIPTQNLTYKGGPFSVAAAWGGVLPVKWGIVVQNYSGQTLSTGCSMSYVGVNAQSV